MILQSSYQKLGACAKCTNLVAFARFGSLKDCSKGLLVCLQSHQLSMQQLSMQQSTSQSFTPHTVCLPLSLQACSQTVLRARWPSTRQAAMLWVGLSAGFA